MGGLSAQTFVPQKHQHFGFLNELKWNHKSVFYIRSYNAANSVHKNGIIVQTAVFKTACDI